MGLKGTTTMNKRDLWNAAGNTVLFAVVAVVWLVIFIVWAVGDPEILDHLPYFR